jgi:hypothetical protein
VRSNINSLRPSPAASSSQHSAPSRLHPRAYYQPTTSKQQQHDSSSRTTSTRSLLGLAAVCPEWLSTTSTSAAATTTVLLGTLTGSASWFTGSERGSDHLIVAAVTRILLDAHTTNTAVHPTLRIFTATTTATTAAAAASPHWQRMVLHPMVLAALTHNRRWSYQDNPSSSHRRPLHQDRYQRLRLRGRS